MKSKFYNIILLCFFAALTMGASKCVKDQPDTSIDRTGVVVLDHADHDGCGDQPAANCSEPMYYDKTITAAGECRMPDGSLGVFDVIERCRQFMKNKPGEECVCVPDLNRPPTCIYVDQTPCYVPAGGIRDGDGEDTTERM